MCLAKTAFFTALRFLPILAVPFLAISALAAEESPAPMTAYPLLKESSLDFHYPPFDKIKDEHYAPAYEQGMAEQLSWGDSG